MKITIKPLKGEAISVEAELSDSVEELKRKVAAVGPQFPADQQKLIYAGKILADGSPLSDYGIKDGEFIVCMVSKAKPTPAPIAPIAPAPAPAAAAATPAAPALAEEAAARRAPADGAAVQQLVAMGFPEAECARALQAAFGNPDRAVEYLMNGIPPEASAAPVVGGGGAPTGAGAGAGGAVPFPAMPFPAMPGGGGGGGGDEGPDEGDEGLDVLEELRNHPNFEELSALVTQNPQMLPQILQALSQTHPELVQAITENPEEFMAMLQEGADGGDDEDDDAPYLASVDGGEAVELSDAENEAIGRLVVLGFDRGHALEAYLLCDKNEELAANYLFDHTDMQD